MERETRSNVAGAGAGITRTPAPASRTGLARTAVDRFCEHTYLPAFLGPDSTVVDLGANRGDFSHGILSRFQCQVFAFEPLSSLRAGIPASPRLTLLPFALGGRSEQARLRVFGSRCASLLRQGENDVLDAEEIVEVLDLRSTLEKIGVEHIDLLKVDIEGAEIEMFTSASDADLRRFTQISVEFHDFIYPEQGSQVNAIKERLRALGFWVINFSLDNTDVLFINIAASGIGRLQYSRLKYLSRYLKGIPRRLSGWRRRIAQSES